MDFKNKLANLARNLETRGLTKLADELDQILDEILASADTTDLTTQEPDASGGSGPLMPSSMAADDGLMADTPGLPAPIALTPEQEKAKLVKRFYRKVTNTCEQQQFFREIPKMNKDKKTGLTTDINGHMSVHEYFKLQSKRLMQCALQNLNQLCARYKVECTDLEKTKIIRDMGFEILDRAGCGAYKYDFVTAMSEYKNQLNTLE